MTETYRNEELAKARTEEKAARDRYQTAKTTKARRQAAEELEFWSNKTAFLANVRL
jgi:hypothetical protein